MANALTTNATPLTETSSLSLERENLPFRKRPLQELLVAVLNELRQNSELRDEMRSEPRWERYFSKAHCQINNRDMNEIGHALNTYHIARFTTSPLRRPEHFSAEDAAAMRIAALVHDLGELGARDLTYDHKNDTHAAVEARYFDQHCADFFPGLDAGELLQVQSIFHTIAHPQNPNEPRARYFNMIERLGYLATTLEVFADRPVDLDWPAICANVCKNQSRHLLHLVDEYSPAREFLAERKSALAEMLGYLQRNQGLLADQVDFAQWDALMAKL
jgi:5'-deoxynucleotidase YfbR-like HD superfamily hydrolase